MSRNKKHFIILATFFSIFIIFQLFGKQIVTYYLDTFHKEICTDNLCINKPKGWMPLIVRRNGTTYLLNTIPKELLFWSESEEDNDSKYSKIEITLEIILVKNNEKIIINSHQNVDENIFLKFEQYSFGNIRCYENSSNSLFCFGGKNIDIWYNTLNFNVIKEILN